MKKSIYIFAVLGPALLLAACGATEAATVPNDFVTATPTPDQPEPPPPKPAPVEEIIATEETMVAEPPIGEEPTANAEVMPTTEVTAPPTKEMMAEQVDKPQPDAAQQQLLAGLPVIGAPPELNNDVWLNSKPLQLADLRSKVVIVEFWTFGWINCIRVIPSLREWHQTYADDGLVIIGVHTPEFSYEKDIDNVAEALVRLDVPYPVAIDNNWQTWRSYNNRYWPAKYIIDKAGNIRYIHIGEGAYQKQEEIIQALLVEEIS